jgi:hypothetical protein
LQAKIGGADKIVCKVVIQLQARDLELLDSMYKVTSSTIIDYVSANTSENVVLLEKKCP